MAKTNMKLDFHGFENVLSELASLGINVEKVTDRAIREAAVQVQKDTVLATSKPNLPARGDYSKGYTDRAIIHFPIPEWDGSICSVDVGFDFSKPGAGGFLISGTPRMQPDRKLHQMYKGKKYMNQLQDRMLNKLWDSLIETAVKS